SMTATSVAMAAPKKAATKNAKKPVAAKAVKAKAVKAKKAKSLPAKVAVVKAAEAQPTERGEPSPVSSATSAQTTATTVDKATAEVKKSKFGLLLVDRTY